MKVLRTYVKFHFNSEGASPLHVIGVTTVLGWVPEAGDFDASKDFDCPEKYTSEIEKLHNVLKGKNVTYKLTTKAVEKARIENT